MKKSLLVIVIFLCLSGFSYAQDYNTSLGLRFGFGTGITLKHFVNESEAIEGILYTRHHGFEVTGLYEWHQRGDLNAEGLDWFFGLGGHLGLYDGRHPDKDRDEEGDFATIGVDGILGLEYVFSKAPISLTLDWKPNFDLVGLNTFHGDGGAFSVRYTF